ncbi:MAG TPA: NADH-quinone oxidoreductase subunit NuoG [Actinomycetota bacterium]|nr:NADH-quinone oxidoreductase subunit NuoG [Actinomycetota bacterium]
MSDDLVDVTINGRPVQAEKGRLLIDVAEEMNVYVPRFCYHPGMKSVAVCRMCLVKVEGMPKLAPACATPVADGMVVTTSDEQSVDAQEGMLEFLLINHPLDCPICDRGGECPLQDQTYRHGPGSTRYVEPKRTYEKALEISDLVVLDRERCVLCWRCVRFSDEIAGDAFIQLVDRGPGTQILTFSDEPFDSYFSGNTIQICPVGALTASTYRFVSRPWDLKTSPGICSYCSVGCPITNEARGDKLVRCQALPNEDVNDFWICDKGRFGFHYVESDERLTVPLVRSGGEFEPTTWGRALSDIAGKLKDAKNVAVLAGGHVSTEDAFATERLARKVVGTANIDSRIQDAGAPYEMTLGFSSVVGSSATLNDVESARTIVWVGSDPKETLPVLYLRLRKAVLDGGAKLIVVSPRRGSLDSIATHVIRCEAGGEAKALAELGSGSGPAARDIGDPMVVCWEPLSAGRDEAAVLGAALNLGARRSAKVLVCPPHAGSQGLLDMGVHPGLEPGYRAAEQSGLDTRAILEAAAAGEIDALVLVGADPIGDFPDGALARRALEKVPFTVAIELFATESAQLADVVLPSAATPERAGTFANLERRLQKFEPLTAPPGSAQEPWQALAAIAEAMGTDWGWETIEDVWADIRKEVPTHAGVDLHVISQSTPPSSLQYESGFEQARGVDAVVAGPGALFPKGHRQGAPFQTGQNWPLSWELRAFEAKERPGVIPVAPEPVTGAIELAGVHPPARHEGRFILYTGRLIYDAGAMVSRSKVLRNIAKKPFVEMNDADVKELGIGDGDEVVVANNGSEARARVVIGDVSAGMVFIPYDQYGLKVNSLIDGPGATVEIKPA